MENWEDGWKRLLDEALRRLINEKEQIQNSAGKLGNEGERQPGRNGGTRSGVSSRVYGEEPIRQKNRNTAGTKESHNSDSFSNSKGREAGRPSFHASAKGRGQGKLPGKLCELYEMIERESKPDAYRFADFGVAWNPLYGWNLYDESYHFYRQAVFMADYEDNEPYRGEIGNVFWPTYQKLDTAQLRGYFTWRVSVRRVYEAYRSYVAAQERQQNSEIVKEDQQGYEAVKKSRQDVEVEKNDIKGLPQAHVVAEAPLCYQYIYVYEVLNQVGVDSAEDGYNRLKFFEWVLDGKNGGILPHLSEWMQDYVIYYRLDRQLLADSKYVQEDQALSVLLDMDEHTPEEVCDAAACLSTYKAGASRYIRENPGQYQDTLYQVLSKMVVYYEKNRKNGFWDSLFGVSSRYPVNLFEGAVFYDRYAYPDKNKGSKPVDFQYELDELRYYSCNSGKWICDGYYRLEKNRTLGQIMCAVDSELREQYGYEHAIRNTLEVKYLNGIVKQEVTRRRKNEEAKRKEEERIVRQTEAKLKREEAERLRQEEMRRKEEEKRRIEREREEEERKKREVVLDFSKLDEIRRAAEVTQQRLIVDEEDEEEILEADINGGEDILCSAGTENTAENRLGLSEAELFILNALLNGGDYKEYFRNHRLMPSIVVESVNEKLFDEIGDVVIEFDGDEPVLVEDYREDVEKLCVK